jgi:hypothetical protein
MFLARWNGVRPCTAWGAGISPARSGTTCHGSEGIVPSPLHECGTPSLCGKQRRLGTNITVSRVVFYQM